MAFGTIYERLYVIHQLRLSYPGPLVHVFFHFFHWELQLLFKMYPSWSKLLGLFLTEQYILRKKYFMRCQFSHFSQSTALLFQTSFFDKWGSFAFFLFLPELISSSTQCFSSKVFVQTLAFITSSEAPLRNRAFDANFDDFLEVDIGVLTYDVYWYNLLIRLKLQILKFWSNYKAWSFNASPRHFFKKWSKKLT